MTARLARPAHFRSGALFATALLSLSSAACFRTLDVSKLHCLDNSGCPSGNYCINGRCLAGQSPVDGSNQTSTPATGWPVSCTATFPATTPAGASKSFIFSSPDWKSCDPR